MTGLAAALAAESLEGEVVIHEATGARYVVVCANCDSRKCMSCVLRDYHDECEDDCPHCCTVERHHVVGPQTVYLARLADTPETP